MHKLEQPAIIDINETQVAHITDLDQVSQILVCHV